MFLLVLAYPGCPGQNLQSRKKVAFVCFTVCQGKEQAGSSFTAYTKSVSLSAFASSYDVPMCSVLLALSSVFVVLRGFLADRTIGRAYGTVCRLSVCLSVCRLSVCLSVCL